MATLRTAIQITDGMSPALRSMNRALSMVISSFETMQSSTNEPMNVASITAARTEIARADAAFNTLEQDIRDARAQQESFNGSMRQGAGAARDLGGSIRNVVGMLGGIYAVKKVADQVDQYANIKARLDLINDGQQTTDQLNDKIMASANRARSAYSDTANVVSKLGITAGQAFSGSDEIIRFTELLSKNFKIAGASTEEQTSAMYQLTQAMAAGKLQGDEFRSISENAPLLAEAIAKQMGVTRGELKQLGADGEITADVIKAAMFNSAAEIEARFSKMPVTFGGVATLIGNRFTQQMGPTYDKISQFVNSVEGAAAINNVALGFVNLANAASVLLMGVMSVYSFFADNWPIIGPIIYGVVGALTAFNTAMLIGSTILAVQGAMATASAAATMLQAGATMAATIEQYGLNAALMGSPLTWYALIVIGIVAAYFALIGAINKFTGTSISATGLVTGAIMWALALIGNGFIGLGQLVLGNVEFMANGIGMFANFFANVFNDPIGSVIHLFGDMADNILGVIERIAKAIDTVFGSNLASSVSGWRSGLDAMVNTAANTYGNGTYKVKYEKFNADEALGKLGINMGRFDMTNAFDKGYNWGKDIKMPGLASKGLDLSDTNALLSGIGADTAGIKDSVSITEEDLRYMRDLAEQEVINRFTTAEVRVEQTNTFGDVRETADLDGVVAYLENQVRDTIAVVAEGAEENV